MSQRVFSAVSATVFLVVAMAHLSRLTAGWDIVIGGWVAPQWISIVGLIVAGLLSVWGFSLASRKGSRRKYRM